MPFSYTTISADGSTNTFAVPFPYISTSHVSVKVNGVATTFTFPTSATVTLTDTAASLTGKTVEIRRTTPRVTRLVDFQDAATLTEASLDLSANQQFYVMQEVSDDNSAKLTLVADDTYDALGKKIKNLAAGTADQDAVNFAQLTAAALSPVTPNATNIAFTPTGAIASTNVQTAINELDTEKASLASPNTFAGDQTISNVDPQLIFIETDGAVDNKRWDLVANAEGFFIRAVNDAASVATDVFAVQRTGTVLDSVTIGGTTVAVNGTLTAGGAFTAGGLATLTGGQLKFPAVAAPSADVNTLDDYREGLTAFTPGLTFGGANVAITYATRTGSYLKLGKLVYFQLEITLTSRGTSAGNAEIIGLPFAHAVSSVFPIHAFVVTYVGSIVARNTGTTNLLFSQTTEAGVQSALQHTNFADTSSVVIAGSYIATA